MEKEIKLEEKEIKEIRSIRSENSRMMVDFGKIKMDCILLNSRLSELEKMESDMAARLKGNRNKEQKISEKLNKKYGVGSVNIEKGTFTRQGGVVTEGETDIEVTLEPVKEEDGKS